MSAESHELVRRLFEHITEANGLLSELAQLGITVGLEVRNAANWNAGSIYERGTIQKQIHVECYQRIKP